MARAPAAALSLAAAALLACEPSPLGPRVGVDAGTGVDRRAADADAGGPERDAGDPRDAAPLPDARAYLDAAPAPLDASEALPDASALDAGPGTVDAGAPPPMAAIDALTVYLNLGDSFGAGYNAGSGRGYAALLCENVPAYPAWVGHDLSSAAPGLRCRNRAESGATSDDVAGGQSAVLPDPGAGDAIVTVYVGGNDFNDNLQTIISETATRLAISRWEQNLAVVVSRLRARYDDPANGRVLVLVLATIHDPTGGLGTIPPTFDRGFCATIQSPLFTPALRARAIANLGAFNDAIRAFAAANGAIVLDSEALFRAHGMNAPAGDRWLDDDCTHGTDEGHHQVRRELWRLLTGEVW